ncbi:MAG: ATP-binding cassette domain-containing protein [Bacteroidota bacterium]
MQVQLLHIGKKFNRQWLFKDLSASMPTASSTALVGNNGSGKSTLLQIIYGWQVPSVGEIMIGENQITIKPEEVHRIASFAAPYLELPEELTFQELLHFHFKFKQLQDGLHFSDLVDMSGLSGNEYKPIRYYSSGMKQRVKLALSLYSKHELLLLDEPCSNLDEQGINWYRNIMINRKQPATTIIASNQSFEYDFCSASLNISDFKRVPAQ